MRINIEEALRLLKAGQVVAIPTETVYGLAADLHNVVAVDQIFALKKRPNDKPLIILLAETKQIALFVNFLPPDFDTLTDKFWPGALTLVIPIRTEIILDTVRAGLETTGFRVPNHPMTRELLSKFGPVVAPSANLSTGPSATDAAHVEQDFGNDFPVIDGGPCQKGIESTILCYQEGEWQISRQGAISVTELTAVLGYTPKKYEALPSALTSNFIPKAKVHLSTNQYDGTIKHVLGFSNRQYPGASKVFYLGDLSEPETIVAKLYSVLRELDDQNVQELWVDFNFPKDGLLRFVADKLLSMQK